MGSVHVLSPINLILTCCRSEGGSGIHVVRHQRDGTRPYHTDTHTGSGMASMHDHGDSIRSIGMGEFVAVRRFVSMVEPMC